jgi:hypothetical protein
MSTGHKTIFQLIDEAEARRRVRPSAPRWPQLITDGGAVVDSAVNVVVVPGRTDPNYALSGGQGICFEPERGR